MLTYHVFRIMGGTLMASPFLNTEGYNSQAEAIEAAKSIGIGAFTVLPAMDTNMAEIDVIGEVEADKKKEGEEA